MSHTDAMMAAIPAALVPSMICGTNQLNPTSSTSPDPELCSLCFETTNYKHQIVRFTCCGFCCHKKCFEIKQKTLTRRLKSKCIICFKGMPRDQRENILRLRKFIDKKRSNIWAVTLLAQKYKTGEGVRRNYSKAIILYQCSIHLGDQNAIVSLGSMFAKGQGVKQSHEKAFKLWKMAADQNHPVGQTNVGYCYSMGLGCMQSLPKARIWWEKAALQGHQLATKNLKKLSEIQQEAKTETKKTSIESPKEECAVCLEEMSVDEDLIQRCFVCTNKIHKSCHNSIQNCSSMTLIQKTSCSYCRSLYVKKHSLQEKILLEKHVKKNLSFAQTIMAQRLRLGRGAFPKNLTRTIDLLKLAIDQNDPNAMVVLGEMYEFGEGVRQSFTMAKKLYGYAWKQKHPQSAQKIGHLYHYGSGVQHNRQLAVEWWQKAAFFGNNIAIDIMNSEQKIPLPNPSNQVCCIVT